MITNGFSSQEDLQIKEYDPEQHDGHTGNPAATAHRQVDHRLRMLASTSAETTRNVVQQSANHLSTEDALVVLANRKPKSSSRKIQRQRQKLRREPEIPTGSQFEIPEELQKMPNGENFVLGDWSDEEKNDRILLMGKLILKCQIFYCYFFRIERSIGGFPALHSYRYGRHFQESSRRISSALHSSWSRRRAFPTVLIRAHDPKISFDI
jgi:hypothetical protein